MHFSSLYRVLHRSKWDVCVHGLYMLMPIAMNDVPDCRVSSSWLSNYQLTAVEGGLTGTRADYRLGLPAQCAQNAPDTTYNLACKWCICMAVRNLPILIFPCISPQCHAGVAQQVMCPSRQYTANTVSRPAELKAAHVNNVSTNLHSLQNHVGQGCTGHSAHEAPRPDHTGLQQQGS